MRYTPLFVALGLAAAVAVAPACTVKDVDSPAFAGPSTFAHSIRLIADRDTITQNGRDTATIRVTATGPNGQDENVKLRAQIKVDGAEQDFGTLSNKEPITPATLTYTAPPPSALAAGQVAQTITIEVTPIQCLSNNCTELGTDFGSTVPRSIDLRLVPQGVILPNNPNLSASFTVSPESPKVLETATFDASATTNAGAACGVACLYSWNFGDGTSGTGMNLTHQYRSINTYNVTLTVTDTRGATAFLTKAVTVLPGTPPSATFTTSPSTPGVEQDVFFNATQSTPAAGRSIVSYEWSFGDGEFGSGVVVTKKYHAPGSYVVQLTTTDDAGSIGKSAPLTMVVGPAVTATPTASLTVSPTSPKANQPAAFNASGSRPGSGANITSYLFNWGDGSPTESQTNPNQTHVYTAAGTFVATVTVTDSLGRTASAQVTVTVAP
jgi:PKD repeat protein